MLNVLVGLLLTIRDLLEVDYKPAADFPADHEGYGFDNIGDVLSLPPILMEKYLMAAEAITDQAVPVLWSPFPLIVGKAGADLNASKFSSTNAFTASEYSPDSPDEKNQCISSKVSTSSSVNLFVILTQTNFNFNQSLISHSGFLGFGVPTRW